MRALTGVLFGLLLLLVPYAALPPSGPVAPSVLLAQAQPASAVAPAPPAAAASSLAPGRVWIGREQEYEAFLASAPIVRFENVPVGVTKPRRGFFAPGGLVESIVFKPLQPGRSRGFFESYKSEIAAYELDKMLDLGMVPPTIEKQHRHEIGSAQLWVDRCVLLKTKANQTAPDPRAWNRQVYRQRVWDNLIANIDRNEGNLLVDENWNLVLIDHSRAFTGLNNLKNPMIRIDRPFYERLKALTAEDVKTRLRGLLMDGPKPLLKRRDAIVAHFDKLIAERGEAAVLTE
jgi:hypothetical protein